MSGNLALEGSPPLTIPAGAAEGYVLTSDGSGNAAWQAAAATGTALLSQTAVKTSAYTATANQVIPVSTTSGNVTVTLPDAPASGTLLAVKHVIQGGTNTVTVTCAGSDVFNKSGGSTTETLSLVNQGLLLQYQSGIWVVLSDDLPLADTDARYAGKAAATENTIYVSLASTASNSNDGLSWGSAKATIAGALTALGSSPGVIQLGYGTFNIDSADGSGNGATLTETGTVLAGLGMQLTKITLGTDVTYGLVAKAARCTMRDFTLEAATGITATYGVGVTTATSAESCRFTNVEISPGAGTITNGFAVSPDNDQDVADTTFVGCRVTGVAGAGWTLGDGTQANVLDTHMLGCLSNGNAYGVYALATGFQWLAGDMGENTTSDIYVTNPSGSPVTVQGMRSENSAALLITGTAASLAAVVSLRDVTWNSSNTYIVSTGIIINHQLSGTLNLHNVQVLNDTSTSPVVPCFILGGTSPQVSVSGLSTNAAINELFSATPGGNVGLVVTSYMQITTSATESATTAGPTNFVSSGSFNFNGTNRDVMIPVTSAAAGNAWNSLLTAPTGATAETFPRVLATGTSSALTSGDLCVNAIGLVSGIAVSNITFVVSATAATLADVTHGWYVLLDDSYVVRAVSADQTSGNWGTANVAVTLSVSGSAYTTTYSGLYYIGVMVVISGGSMPTFVRGGTLITNGINTISPVLYGQSSTGQTTPPATGTTMASITTGSLYNFYGYTS
jgi:hypothetical protein